MNEIMRRLERQLPSNILMIGGLNGRLTDRINILTLHSDDCTIFRMSSTCFMDRLFPFLEIVEMDLRVESVEWGQYIHYFLAWLLVIG